MINVTGGAPGEVKLSVRIESVEMTPNISLTVARQTSAEAPAGAPAPTAARGGSTPATPRATRASREGVPAAAEAAMEEVMGPSAAIGVDELGLVEEEDAVQEELADAAGSAEAGV